ncbi:MAG: cytochrome c oxidase subunit II [Acidobacteria bacterium]|nr:cytochrome c oxidase subunit II [Acidobacteriota bacterium]
MPFLLAVVIWAVSLGLAIPFFTRTWWFPQSINEHGRQVDQQFMFTLVVTGVVFILAQAALGWVVLRFGRPRAGAANYSHGNNTMEVLWTSATAVLFIGLTIMGQRVWARVHFMGAPEGAIPIELTGQQFVWNIRYPGPDGKFGALDIKQINDQAGNPLGVDSKDPAGKDDITVPTMAVPVNKPIELRLRSKDVTHSFFVPELRLKQDTVPGMVIRIHFTAEKVGRYEIACAELCGLGHYKMRSFLDVMEQADYEKWLKEHAPQP